jgi:hypothetical protein
MVPSALFFSVEAAIWRVGAVPASTVDEIEFDWQRRHGAVSWR